MCILAGQPLPGPWEENSSLCAPGVISVHCTAAFAASSALLGNQGLLAACGGESGSTSALQGEIIVNNQQLLVKVEVK